MAVPSSAAMSGEQPSLSELARASLRIGALGFGGPAGQIALMHRELVERLRWVDEASYLRALSFCALLPGPEAQQLATWCGWRLRGAAGGLIAGGLFILPGALVMAALTLLYVAYGTLPTVSAFFFGLQATVLAVVAQALFRVARRAANGRGRATLAVLAFAALFFFDVPFPMVVLIAGAFGAWAFRKEAAGSVDARSGSWAESVQIAIGWTAIWLAPIVVAALVLGNGHRLVAIGELFARLAALSFGGAYAALSYAAQTVVQDRGWLTAHQMLDGLGLAETTPGPLILVFQFVGGLAGAGGSTMPLTGAAAGMAMALWATFAPSFLWIFTFAPHLDRLMAKPRLAGALAGIAAAVVGVMASLALWFALGLLFGGVREAWHGPLRLWLPVGGFNFGAALIALGALLLLTRTRLPLPIVILAGAFAGVVVQRVAMPI